MYPRAGLRPTKDVTRQAIFNIIGSAVHDARVADLYAGGGSLGIEALSRGAAEVVFVEQASAVMRFLRENVKGLDSTKTLCADVLVALRRLGAHRFDIVLADPPYRSGLVQATLDQVVTVGSLELGGIFVVEHHQLEPPGRPEGWELLKVGRYGESHVTVLRRNRE